MILEACLLGIDLGKLLHVYSLVLESRQDSDSCHLLFSLLLNFSLELELLSIQIIRCKVRNFYYHNFSDPYK